ncbi:MAG: DUF2283 domain-containing protein [Thermomicrobiales bacterium]
MNPANERTPGTTVGQTMPPLTELDVDPALMEHRYDRDSDTLFIHFYGEPRPAVSIEMDDGLYLRWDREGGQLVGMQLEDFLSVLVPRHAVLLEVADMLEIDPKRIAKMKRQLSPETRKRAAWEVLGSMIQQPAPTGPL